MEWGSFLVGALSFGCGVFVYSIIDKIKEKEVKKEIPSEIPPNELRCVVDLHSLLPGEGFMLNFTKTPLDGDDGDDGEEEEEETDPDDALAKRFSWDSENN